MVHIVNNSRQAPRASGRRELTDVQKRAAGRKVSVAEQRNPLRRVRLSCCGWVRDPLAVLGDWVWCEHCADHRRVLELAA